MKFCHHCTELMQRSSLQKHSMIKHSTPGRALKIGEKPVDPIYRNWQDWIKDPANTIPRLNVEQITELDMESLGLGRDNKSDHTVSILDSYDDSFDGKTQTQTQIKKTLAINYQAQANTVSCGCENPNIIVKNDR